MFTNASTLASGSKRNLIGREERDIGRFELGAYRFEVVERTEGEECAALAAPSADTTRR